MAPLGPPATHNTLGKMGIIIQGKGCVRLRNEEEVEVLWERLSTVDILSLPLPWRTLLRQLDFVFVCLSVFLLLWKSKAVRTHTLQAAVLFPQSDLPNLKKLQISASSPQGEACVSAVVGLSLIWEEKHGRAPSCFCDRENLASQVPGTWLIIQNTQFPRRESSSFSKFCCEANI